MYACVGMHVAGCQASPSVLWRVGGKSGELIGNKVDDVSYIHFSIFFFHLYVTLTYFLKPLIEALCPHRIHIMVLLNLCVIFTVLNSFPVEH